MQSIQILSIGGGFKQTLLMKFMSLQVCETIWNLFKMLMKFTAFCCITCFNSQRWTFSC
jgi:hypothetical protein